MNRSEGFYLYGVRKSQGASSAFSAQGIDGVGHVFVVTEGGLEAIVSLVPLAEFDSEGIRLKAREDLGWIKDKAVRHEAVIDEALREGGEFVALIPMKFGTIFRGEQALRDRLTQYHDRFLEMLENLDGKQEWGVKAYLADPVVFERAVRADNAAILAKAGEIAGSPEGLAFFLEEDLREVVSREMKRDLSRLAQELYERLGHLAEASVQKPVLGKELTGRREAMVLNAACLVLVKDAEKFGDEARKLDLEIREKGLDLEISGPWPAYHFAAGGTGASE